MAANGAGKAPVTEQNTQKAPVPAAPVHKIMINPHAGAKRPSPPSPVNKKKYSNSSQFGS